MNNKAIKLIFSLIILVLIISLATSSFCYDPSRLTGDTSSSTATSVKTQANKIIRIVQVIATATAVIILIWLGVKYMSAAPSERADIKKSATIYIVGAVLLFATTGILAIIQTFAGNLTTDNGKGGPVSVIKTEVSPDGKTRTKYLSDGTTVVETTK